MRRLLKIILIVISYWLLVISHAELDSGSVIFAADDFAVDIVASYEVNEDNTTYINYDTRLTNLNTEKYATSYSFSIKKINFEDLKVTTSSGEELKYNSVNEGSNAIITIFFNKPIFGKGEKQEFTVSLKSDSLVEKKGDVWDIHIPKIDSQNNISSFFTKIYVPNNFGDLAFVSQNNYQKEETKNHKIYTFNNLSTKSSINLAFGRFQVYSFHLIYHLENPLSQETSMNIALPPDTHFQKVMLSSLAPQPTKIEKDIDGNWVASYVLKDRQQLEIHAKGFVQVFSVSVLDGEDDNEEYLNSLLLPTKYWQSDNPQIKSTANSLQSAANIYNFIVDTLEYQSEPELRPVSRKGSLSALNNPIGVICTEYTDLFIALSRAAGIPSREINGYAISSDPQAQPLGLVKDVLHSWPEYWDSEEQIWKPVDPTWEDTSGGQDYFNSFDLNHIAFAIHGQNSETPIPAGTYKFGANPQRDVFIELASLPDDTRANFDIEILPIQSGIFQKKYEIVITNRGPAAAYDESVEIYFDGSLQKELKLTSLIPLETTRMEIKTGIGPFAKNMPGKISVDIKDDTGETLTNKQSLKTAYIIGTFIALFSATAVLFIEIYKVRK